MAHKQHGHVSGLYEVLDALLALLLEEDVADRERLVDDQDVGLGDGGDGEGDARHHAARVVLEWHVHEILELGELDDLVELGVDELLGVPQERSVEVDVLTGGELHVEARAELDERGDVAADGAGALARLEHAGDDLEHGGLAGSVGAHQPYHVSALHLERDVLQGTELGEEELMADELDEILLEVVELLRRHVEDHRDVVDLDGVFGLGADGVGHGDSLDIENELVLGLAEDRVADRDRQNGPQGAHAERHEARIGLEQEDVAHELQVVVHGVRVHEYLQDMGHLTDEIDGPEDRGEVGPSRDDDAPEVLHVAEEHGERREQKTQTHAEDDEQEQRDGKPDQMPGRHDAEPQHDDSDRHEREGEVDEREQRLLDGEHEAVDLDLLEERGRPDDGVERLRGRVGHERERDVADDEVQRVELGGDGAVAPLGEDGAEDDRHDDHHEQGVEHAPGDSQDGAAIFDLEVFGDELPQDEDILLERRLGKDLDVVNLVCCHVGTGSFASDSTNCNRAASPPEACLPLYRPKPKFIAEMDAPTCRTTFSISFLSQWHRATGRAHGDSKRKARTATARARALWCAMADSNRRP